MSCLWIERSQNQRVLNKTKNLHRKPEENIKTKIRSTGRNTTIWKYQKH